MVCAFDKLNEDGCYKDFRNIEYNDGVLTLTIPKEYNDVIVAIVRAAGYKVYGISLKPNVELPDYFLDVKMGVSL